MSSTPDEPPGRWLRELRRRTDGPVRVRLSCDWYVGFPIEVMTTHGFGYVGPEMLGLSPLLTADLADYQRWWEEHSAFDDDQQNVDRETPAEKAAWRRWREDGRRLVERLGTELGPGCAVSWV